MNRNTLLALLTMILLFSGACLIMRTFSPDLFLWPGYRDLTPADKPLLWAAGAGGIILGILTGFWFLRRTGIFIPRWKKHRREGPRI